MAAALNGMALSKLRPYGSTFFTFFDYCKPSVRLSRHRPLAGRFTSSRTIRSASAKMARRTSRSNTWPPCGPCPASSRIRPGDANEATEAWRTLMRINDRPVALILTRQNLPTLDRTKYAAASGLAKGAYVLADAAGGKPKVILIGTGSEVSPVRGGLRATYRRKALPPAWSACPRGNCSKCRTKIIATACCRRTITARVAVRSRRPPRLGSLHRLQRPLRRHAQLRRQRPRPARASSTSTSRPSTCWKKRKRLSPANIP